MALLNAAMGGARMDRMCARLSAGLMVSVLVVAGVGVTCPVVAAAAAFNVSGVVYWDVDNDGVRDAGEPGVPGIRVHRSTGNGTPTTTTGADGSYLLSGLSSSTSGYINVESGWFRSQCAKLTCATGPGPDNDYATANAFIRYPLANLTGTTTDLDVGLLPDWPGSASAAPVVGGVVPANQVDVAARLSWIRSTCPGGAYLICRPGDTYVVRSQIHNQGTSPLTGVTVVLDLPPSDSLATGNPAKDVTLVTGSSPPDVTGINVLAWDPATGSVTVKLAGAIPPGGNAVVQTQGLVVGGPGTPGCIVGAPTSSCPKGEPQGAPLTLAVTHIDQPGDPDSFGPDCTPVLPITLCATGIHDKQVEPDEVDPVGHNVAATAASSTSYNLTSRVVRLAPAGDTGPGEVVRWRVSAFNSGPAPGLPGWTLTLVLPSGTAPETPASNAVRTCQRGTTATGYPRVTCTGKGPLSPGVTSFAMDVSTTVPIAAPPSTTLSAMAFVTPAPTQGAETVPLGTPPTTPGGDATMTATDNDSSASVRTRP